MKDGAAAIFQPLPGVQPVLGRTVPGHWGEGGGGELPSLSIKMPLEPGTDSSVGICVETGIFLTAVSYGPGCSSSTSAPLKPGVFAAIQGKASALQKPVAQICS